MRLKTKILLSMISVVAIMFLAAVPVCAQDVSKQKNRKAQLEKEISILDAQIAEIKSKSSSATASLNMLRKNIENRRSLIEESNAVIKIYDDSIHVKNKAIKKLQQDVDTLTFYYERLVRTAYKYRDPHVWYLYVFASDDIGQAFRRAGYFRNISGQIRKNAEELKEKKSELEQQKLVLDSLKREVVAVRDARQKELNSLRKDEKDADNLVQKLKKSRKSIEKQVSDKKKEVKALNKEIQKKIEAAQKKKTSTGSKADDAVAAKLSAEFENNKGALPWPVTGVVVSNFGKQYHPVFKNLELPANEGIDIAVSVGETVNSIFDGQVLDVFVMPSYGQCVLIQHGKAYFTFYCKLGSIAVKKGDKVKTGQKIGVADTMNGVTQIHFEIWKNKVPQNPMNWLRNK